MRLQIDSLEGTEYLNPRSGKNVSFRARLAAWVVGLSLAAITGISILAVTLALPSDRSRVTQLVFSSVLPLFGTWVGTVLAFYFARENLEAATQSTLRLTRGHKEDDSVSEVMIPRDQIIYHTSSGGKQVGDIKLTSIASIMSVTGKKRVPIMNEKGSVKFIIHQSLLDSHARTVNSDNYQELTLSDLLSFPKFRTLAEAIGFVSITATLGEARDQMQRVHQCNDIFVTASGVPSEPALGWITNNLLATIQ